jgi:hypothetical protein
MLTWRCCQGRFSARYQVARRVSSSSSVEPPQIRETVWRAPTATLDLQLARLQRVRATTRFIQLVDRQRLRCYTCGAGGGVDDEAAIPVRRLAAATARGGRGHAAGVGRATRQAGERALAVPTSTGSTRRRSQHHQLRHRPARACERSSGAATGSACSRCRLCSSA